MTVADRIRITREEKGLTQEQLALRMGYTGKSSVSKIEISGNDITLKKVSRVAEALGVTPSYLMGWEVDEEEAENEAHRELVKRALDAYEKYKNATPEVQAAIDLLLKSSQPKS